VLIVTPRARHCLPLASCEWVAGKSSHDEFVAMYLPVQPAIMLLTDHGRFTVTNLPGEVELWEAFLTLARPRAHQPLGCGMTGLLFLAAVTGGGVVGATCGAVLSRVWPQPFLVASLTFLGAMDGMVAIGSYVAVRHLGRSFRKEYSVLSALLALLVVGAKVTIGDWRIRGPIIVVNAILITLVIYLTVYRPLKANDESRIPSSE
jgi:hypothetical protein